MVERLVTQRIVRTYISSNLYRLFGLLQLVNDCNEGARKMERMEEICVLQTQVEFKTKVWNT